jgi:23S rRNA (uracil1939-C5)-methyltransferase
MAIIASIEGKVSEIDENGLGVCDKGIDKIRIPYLCLGEEVALEKHKYRGKTNFLLKSVLSKSSDRIDAFCKYYTKCGGCNMQHLNHEAYEKYKYSILQNILDKLSITDISPQLVKLGNFKRRRLNLFFKKDEESLIKLGFYRYNSDNIIHIDECAVAENELSSIIHKITELLNNLSELNSKGEVHILQSSNGISIIIEFKTTEYFDEKRKRKLKSFLNIDNVIFVELKCEGNKILTLSKEDPYINLSGIQVAVEADCFLQPTHESDRVIPNIICEMLKNVSGKIADLFSGRGTYTIPLLTFGKIIDSYENNEESLLALSESIRNFTEYSRIQKRDLYTNPLSNELSGYSAIVINPPRSGAYNQSEKIAQGHKLDKIIYVSCNPSSFIYDAKILLTKYKLKNLVGIDQFKYTNHIEILAEFD